MGERGVGVSVKGRVGDQNFWDYEAAASAVTHLAIAYYELHGAWPTVMQYSRWRECAYISLGLLNESSIYPGVTKGLWSNYIGWSWESTVGMVRDWDGSEALDRELLEKLSEIRQYGVESIEEWGRVGTWSGSWWDGLRPTGVLL